MLNRVILILLVHVAVGYQIKSELSKYWTQVGIDEILLNRNKPRIEKRAKNMILFVGDGMSIPTVTAARIWKAQRVKDKHAGQPQLAFEKSPYVALSKTYTDNNMVADSAATATAMLTGIKTNARILGLDSRVEFKNCSSFTPDAQLTNIFTYAAQAGMATGVVTNTALTHATPAASYGYSVCRFWESDADAAREIPDPKLRKRCPDLASQLLTNAINFDVILGGGRGKFLPKSQGGERNDGRNIIQEWQTKQQQAGRRQSYVETKTDLHNSLNDKGLNRLLGIFGPGHLPFVHERKQVSNYSTVPSLAEMTETAIKTLSRNDKGFFLLVESGRIDFAHHYGYARRAIEEVLELEEAFQTAQRLTRSEDTLMIVTADHSHGMTIGGYPARGDNIFGIPRSNTERKGPGIAADGLPYTILLYHNGPGAPKGVKRPDPTKKDTASYLYRQQAAVPLRKETHGGDDVAIYASGPMAHLVGGVREQSYIGHVFMYASCLGPYQSRGDCPTSGSQIPSVTVWTLVFSVLTTIWTM